MNHSIDDIIQNIRNFRVNAGLSKSGLASIAGISEGTTRNMDDDDWYPTSNIIKKLEAAITEFQSKPSSAATGRSKNNTG